MSHRKKLIVAAAACGACCAAPLAIVPALMALGFTGAGLTLAAWARWIDVAATAILAAVAGAIVVLWLRRRRAVRNLCIVPPDHSSRGRQNSSAR